MKEYCTLVTTDISSAYGGWPKFCVHNNEGVVPGDSQLQSLLLKGWEVIDATCVPKLSTVDHEPKFAFILEREARAASSEGEQR